MPITTCVRCGELYDEPDTDTAEEPGWLRDVGASRRVCCACLARDLPAELDECAYDAGELADDEARES